MVKVTPVEFPFTPVLTVAGAFGVKLRLVAPLTRLNAGALTVTVCAAAPARRDRAARVHHHALAAKDRAAEHDDAEVEVLVG